MKQFLILFRNRQFQSIAFTQILLVLSSSLLSPVLPVHLKREGFADAQIGMIMGILAVGALIIRPLAGLSIDTRGSRQILLFGMTITGMCFTSYLWANTFMMFFAIRFFHGIAIAFQGTGSITFASSVEKPENISSAISVFTLCTMIGMGIGTSTAPFLFEQKGFQPLVLFSLISMAAAFSIMALRAKSLPLSTRGERAPYLTVIKNRDVLSPTVCLFASNFASSAAFTFVPLAALSSGTSQYSAFFLAFTVAVISARLFVNYLNNRYTPERAALYASYLNALSILCIAVHQSVPTLIISGILHGIGYGVVFPSLTV